MEQQVQFSNSAIFSLLGGMISVLGASVVGLTVYSFRSAIAGLRESLEGTCRKIEALFKAHDRQGTQISLVERELASLRAEHALMVRTHCLRRPEKVREDDEDDP